jgi:hypothetical protein
MGHWGPGIFDDDVAQDVRLEFEEQLRSGQSVAAATHHLIDAPPWGWDDEEDAAVTYLALAGLQLEHRALDPAIRDKAIAIIDSEVPLWRWEGSPPERIAERVRVLGELREQLITYSQET